ncbi:MAG: ribosomal protein L7/L12 [Ruminococcus sp.]|nr:ribosomal protein L7/L12 [Ruminococcus sp.]
MKKLIKNTAITALAFTVAAVGAVYLPSPLNYGGNDTASVTEYSDDGIVLLSNEDTAYIRLDSFDAAKKIPVIKAVREVTGLGLGKKTSILSLRRSTV